jgi:hypothetical protein
VRPAFARDPGEATDGAARAVAAGQVAGTELLGAPVLMAKRAGEVLSVRCRGDELHAPLDTDAAGSQVLVQHRLGLGLRDEEQEWVRGVLEPDVKERGAHHPLAEAQLQRDGVVAPLDQLP